jgi:hypothetical protein
MTTRFENNGDWPDTDEDFRKLDEEDGCFFCHSTDSCICDEVYDIANEEAFIYELESMDD